MLPASTVNHYPAGRLAVPGSVSTDDLVYKIWKCLKYLKLGSLAVLLLVKYVKVPMEPNLSGHDKMLDQKLSGSKVHGCHRGVDLHVKKAGNCSEDVLTLKATNCAILETT